jgi:hypothetical protein
MKNIQTVFECSDVAQDMYLGYSGVIFKSIGREHYAATAPHIHSSSSKNPPPPGFRLDEEPWFG